MIQLNENCYCCIKEQKIKYLQSNHDFESIINSPLSTGEGTNHDNAKRKSSGEETNEAHLLNSL